MLGHLFVYGTLRSDVGHPMHAVLVAHARLLGKASVPGELYAVREYVALVTADGHSRVTGEVYEINAGAIERLLTTLDEYEGLSDPAQDEYRREVVTTMLPDGGERAAWAYVLNRSAEGLRRIPSGDYKDSSPKYPE